MSTIGQSERTTQNRVVALFRDELKYRYLGDWTDRDGNSNIEESLLSAWLTKCGYSSSQVSVALHKLRTEANNHNRTLYGNNQAVYNLLRYGVPVKVEAGKVTETVHLVDWKEPDKNDFAIAEEVTLHGGTDHGNGVSFDHQDGSALGAAEGAAQSTRTPAPLGTLLKARSEGEPRIWRGKARNGRAGQAFALFESGVVDRATANSSPQTATGHKQDDQAAKTKPPSGSCSRILDQSLGSARVCSSRNRPLE